MTGVGPLPKLTFLEVDSYVVVVGWWLNCNLNCENQKSHGHDDELGEIVVTDKRILLILAMDVYAVKQIYSYYSFLLLLLSSFSFI